VRRATGIGDALVETLTDEREVDSIAVRPHPYRTSHWLACLDVEYADGSFEALVLKDLGPGSLGRAARRIKPRFVHDPIREIEVYRTILEGARLGTAAFRGAVVDPSHRRFWLVIERVEASELWQHGSLDAWCGAASWLAGMHSELHDAVSEHLVHWTADHIQSWISRAGQLCDDASVEVAARRSAELTERLMTRPAGFVHGELYASNVLVDERSGRVCPLDWEMAGIGPQLLDLAALTSGAWTGEERREIATAYWRRSGGSMSLAELLHDLDLCRLLIALQWLGWSRRWKAPKEHAHDWLTDVQVLVKEVGLA
jgi:aminoglycoside phosphotransferase (APT) family kinase protein